MDIIHRHSGLYENITRIGPYELEPLIRRKEEGAFTCYRLRIAPHSRTAISYHAKAEEIYYVLSGHGVAILNNQHYELQPGDFLRLPPGTHHGFVTKEEALELLDIHSPGSWPDRDLYFVQET